MIRKIRFLTALVTVASLLFAQLAAAAYSCPMADTSPAAATMAMPCDLEPVGNANLCDNHCNYGSASVDSSKNAPAFEQAVDTGLRIPAVTALAHRMDSPRSRAIAPAASPPFVRFTVLRI
jgi:hypothetical protein